MNFLDLLPDDVIEKINQALIYLKDCITILQKINKKKDDDNKKCSACSINGKKYELLLGNDNNFR